MINNQKEFEAILLIADISGYTNFMLANKNTLTRSHTVIVELIRSIIEDSGIPLQIAKLEGDAVFLYAIKNDNDNEWNEIKKKVGESVNSFFGIFSRKIHELSNSIICDDNSCLNIDQLGLKVIIHYGKTQIVSIGNFKELAGLDVILIHRLLKNSVKVKEYILMTEEACKQIMFPKIICVDTTEEHYKDFGAVKTYVYYN